MTTVMRTLGGSVGSRIDVSVIAAAACGLAVLASLAVPPPAARVAGALVPDAA
jgi:hypothetical protein